MLPGSLRSRCILWQDCWFWSHWTEVNTYKLRWPEVPWAMVAHACVVSCFFFRLSYKRLNDHQISIIQTPVTSLTLTITVTSPVVTCSLPLACPVSYPRFRILEAQMETGTPYMLYKASFPSCLFILFWKNLDVGSMRIYYEVICFLMFSRVLCVVDIYWLNSGFSSRIMPIANPTSRTWAPSIAPTYVVRSLSTLLQMKSRCAI